MPNPDPKPFDNRDAMWGNLEKSHVYLFRVEPDDAPPADEEKEYKTEDMATLEFSRRVKACRNGRLRLWRLGMRQALLKDVTVKDGKVQAAYYG